MPRKFLRASAVAIALYTVTAMALALRPEAPPRESSPLFEGARIDESTLALFQRACQDCHSDKTRWPWYSRIPPASWLIAKDINDGRRQADFSRWNSYSAEEQENLLARIGSAARTGQMPLSRYTILHRDAVLTRQERQEIYEWSKAERRRLRLPASVSSAGKK